MTEFSLEKVLEIDLNTYLESQGRTAVDYNFVGIRFENSLPHRVSNDFVNYGDIPEETEVIVNYRIVLWDDYNSNNVKIVKANAYGTALVPVQKRK